MTFCQNLADTVNVEYSKNSPKRFSLGFGPPISEIGYTHTPNLNEFLRLNKIEPSETFYNSIPINLTYQINRIKLEFGFNTPLPSSLTNFEVRGKSVIGYAIFSERNYFIYFNAGIGYASFNRKIDFQSSTKPIVSLASVIQTGVGRTISLENENGFLDFSLESLMRPKNPNAVGTSIKMGYRYGLAKSAWTASSVKLIDTPSDRMNGFYLQATINIFREQKSKKRVQNALNQ